MRIKQYTLILILFSSVLSFGAKTVVKGYAKKFAGKEISFSVYKDYITEETHKIGYTTIKENGSYTFEFDANKTEKLTLKIEDKSAWFFTEAGKVYNVSLSYDAEANKQRVYDKKLSFYFNFPAPSELNQQLKKFNDSFDKFIEDNIVLFKKRDNSIAPKLKEFKTKMLKEVEETNSQFVKNYVKYSIGSTENALDVSYSKEVAKQLKNLKANLYLEYLDNKPVLYNNTEYIKFFKNFFRGELKDLSLEVQGMDITKAINETASYTSLNKALSKYPFLQNKEFKSLFTLYGLMSISKDKYYEQKNVLKILTEIKNAVTYPEQKIIAANIIKKITAKKFGNGSVAPKFELKDKNGELVSLTEFKGKPVYINFWTNWSIPSQKEMKIMQTLYKKYKNKVHFISICADNDYKKMTSFLNKNEDYNWDFLHIGKNNKLLEEYNIYTFPTYILLDERLVVYQFPAARPGGTAERATELNIDKILYDLTK